MSQRTDHVDESRSAAAAAVCGLVLNEAAAVETYTRAIGAAPNPGVIEHLQRIRDDHLRAERELRAHLADLDARPDARPAPWGGVEALIGRPGAAPVAPLLAALRRGEEQALGAYEYALRGDDLYPDCRRTVCTHLLPAGRQHVDDLDRLLAGS